MAIVKCQLNLCFPTISGTFYKQNKVWTQSDTWWSIFALNYTFPYSLTVAPASGHAYNQLALIEVSKGMT